MQATIAIANFIFAFMDRLPALYAAGVDVSQAYAANKAKALALAETNTAPSNEDWDEMHASLKPLEDSIQAAHRDDAAGSGQDPV